MGLQRPGILIALMMACLQVHGADPETGTGQISKTTILQQQEENPPQEIPMPGQEEPEEGESSEKRLPFGLNLTGYVENTFNAERLRGDGQGMFLNVLRGRLNIFSRPDPHFDFSVTPVGNLYLGDITFNLAPYLPEETQGELIPPDPESRRPGTAMFLNYEFEDELYLQEAFGTLYASRLKLRGGRQKFYSGTGYAFNPIDLFNRKDPLDPTYEVDGLDAILADVALPGRMEFEGAAVFSDPFSTTDYQARLKKNVRGWDTALQYTYFLEERVDWETVNTEEALTALSHGLPFDAFIRPFRWHMVAGEYAGGLKGIGLYGEGGYVWIDEPQDIGTLEQAGKDHARFLVGMDYTFETGLYFLAEYMYLGQGRTDPSEITLNDRLAYLTGEILAIDRDTLVASVSYPTTPLTEVALTGLTSLDDPSAIIQPWFYWDVYPGLKFSATAYVAVGDEQGQNGRFGSGGFIRLKYYF